MPEVGAGYGAVLLSIFGTMRCDGDCAMSGVSTYAKCRPRRAMSEFGAKAEDIYSGRVFRILTQSGRFSGSSAKAGLYESLTRDQNISER
jgi:hypothetical protein